MSKPESFTTPPRIDIVFTKTGESLKRIVHNNETYFLAEPNKSFEIRYYFPAPLPEADYAVKFQVDGQPTGYNHGATNESPASYAYCNGVESVEGTRELCFAAHQRMSLNQLSKGELVDEVKIGTVSAKLYPVVKKTENLRNVNKESTWKAIDVLNVGKEKFPLFPQVSVNCGKLINEKMCKYTSSLGEEIIGAGVTVFYDTSEN